MYIGIVIDNLWAALIVSSLRALHALSDLLEHGRQQPQTVRNLTEMHLIAQNLSGMFPLRISARWNQESLDRSIAVVTKRCLRLFLQAQERVIANKKLVAVNRPLAVLLE